MKAGLSARLDQVRARYRGYFIEQDAETGVWVAIARPSPTSVICHVRHTLAELDARLAETGAGQ